MELQARDKRALIGGAVGVTGLLAYLLWPSGATQSQVELVSAEQRQGGPAAPTPAAPQPQPQPQPAQAAPPGQPAPSASPVPEGMRLTGVVGGGAIFSFPDGSQRLIQRGRDVAPGVTLQAVRLREVTLLVGAAPYRMGFGGPATPLQPTAVPVPAPAPGAQPAPPPPPTVATPAPTAPVPNANLAR